MFQSTKKSYPWQDFHLPLDKNKIAAVVVLNIDETKVLPEAMLLFYRSVVSIQPLTPDQNG